MVYALLTTSPYAGASTGGATQQRGLIMDLGCPKQGHDSQTPMSTSIEGPPFFHRAAGTCFLSVSRCVGGTLSSKQLGKHYGTDHEP